MSKLIILSGIPGAGKTTYAHNIKSSKVVSNDEIRFNITKGRFPGQFIWDHLPILRKQFKEVIKDVGRDSVVVLDSTMLTNKRRIACFNKFKDYFDEIELHIFVPNLDKSIKQNSMRDRVVPLKQIQKMYDEFEYPDDYVIQNFKIFYIF